MSWLRRPLRLAVQGPAPGLAFFKWRAPGDPVLEHFEPSAAPPSWRLIRRVDGACAGVAGLPFLQIEVRTPYGESITEAMVASAMREALGPKSETLALQGWHVTHLEDTHLGSQHRVFATLAGADESERPGLWDQLLPLELAVVALGDWTARTTGRSQFQLVLARGGWIYSLAYRHAQAYHLIRVSDRPFDFACKRLSEHRLYAQEPGDGEEFAVFADLPASAHVDISAALGETRPLPSPPGYGGGPKPGADLWHFGLALAAVREEGAIHNRAGARRQDANLEIRMWDRLAKTALAALLLGGLAFLGEGARLLSVRSALAGARAQAAQYASRVEEIQALRAERRNVLDSLLQLRPLWHRPTPVDRVLRGIAAALPPHAGLDGVLLRTAGDGKKTVSFLGWVGDWNEIRPVQERLRKLPYFSDVALSDQRQDPSRKRVSYHATCTLAETP